MWQYFGNSNSQKNVDINGNGSPPHPLLFPKGRRLECDLEVMLGRSYSRLSAGVTISSKFLSDKFSCLKNMKSEEPSDTPTNQSFLLLQENMCWEGRWLRLFSICHCSWYFCHANISHESELIVLTFNSVGLSLNFILIAKAVSWAVEQIISLIFSVYWDAHY